MWYFILKEVTSAVQYTAECHILKKNDMKNVPIISEVGTDKYLQPKVACH